MRWLCISDIHGDARALAAVLATAERHGYDKLLVAGDLCFPGAPLNAPVTHSQGETASRADDARPLEVWRRLVQAHAVCVQGVTDRAIATLDPSNIRGSTARERQRLQDLARVRADLGDLILARLLKLPTQVRLPMPDGRELLLVHGSPADPTEPFTYDMSDSEVAALIGDDPADVIVCGGSHVPFDRTVMGVRIVNVGSVGEAPSGGGPRHAEATFLELSAPFGPGKGAPPRIAPARIGQKTGQKTGQKIGDRPNLQTPNLLTPNLQTPNLPTLAVEQLVIPLEEIESRATLDG